MNWAESTLAGILDRAARTEDMLAGRWPLYADPATGEWRTTSRGSWTGGFWAGLLWLRARYGGDPADRDVARHRTEALRPWLTADTATRGLIFWYGTALSDATALRDEAAAACARAYDPALGIVPWGTAFGGPGDLARVDAAPGLIPLLAHTPGGAGIARAHLERQVTLTTGDPDLPPAWRPAPLDRQVTLTTGAPGLPPARRPRTNGWTRHPDPPAGWSRTPSWLALAVAGHEDLARRVLRHPVVAARFDVGAAAPGDTSATAIDAVAALHLAPAHGSWLRARGEELLAGLVSGHVRQGRLLGGCYDQANGVASRHELVWGDFFLALGLAALIEGVPPC
ncbi:hypothetical protein Aph01nite_19520 [Acrocarpospora phusangensis]|uniref:Sugar ABC transporter permease n=1 Tax=Acrocarpospora phusangensis TaxID=1070424 RepID=A0A919UMR2_9ACTN|nr:hypothetical protein [Acrocarpospora phusangensis]GIH23642.1 hypothetical protein Aph01nite_19520 [Acrocarpospora phusangensis]